jgi:hypothetical protein
LPHRHLLRIRRDDPAFAPVRILSPEPRVAARLADIAETNAVSVNTLRAQLLSLFRKLGVHRQADRVRMASTSRYVEDED